MPRIVHRNQNVSRSGARPNRGWSSAQSLVNVTVPAATKTLLASFVLSNPGIDETILRTVGVFGHSSDQFAADEFRTGGFGMMVVTDTAAAVGATAIPGPVTNAADDGWFLHHTFVQEIEVITGAGFETNAMEIIRFDSKAKRIVAEGSSIVLMAENISASTGMNVAFAVRILGMVRGTG